MATDLDSERKEALVWATKKLIDQHEKSARILAQALYHLENDDYLEAQLFLRKLRPIWESVYGEITRILFSRFPEVLSWFGSKMDNLKPFTSNN